MSKRLRPKRTCMACFGIGLSMMLLFWNDLDILEGDDPTIHILVLFVDHWEPTYDTLDEESRQLWMQEYPAFAKKLRDFHGRPLQHTWFYWNGTSGGWTAPDSLHITSLTRLVYEGFGEIEVHIHHAEDGTPEEAYSAFVQKMESFLEAGARWGLYTPIENCEQKTFAFIHGMWALDNSRRTGKAANTHREHCGVNLELTALKQLGCYADFTFPAWGPMNPKRMSALYYVRDDPRPWSYGYDENIFPMVVGGEPQGDLLLFQGPRSPMPSSEESQGLSLSNMDRWVAEGVHVKGQPKWKFVKLHTHGIQQAGRRTGNERLEGPALLWGEPAARFWTGVLEKYNDGKKYRLHFITAREAYNIARAAESGKKGDPYDYLDYIISPYVCNRVHSLSPFELIAWKKGMAELRMANKSGCVQISIKRDGFDRVEESGDGVLWTLGDGQLDVLDGLEITMKDATPSLWYRFHYHSRPLWPSLLSAINGFSGSEPWRPNATSSMQGPLFALKE